MNIEYRNQAPMTREYIELRKEVGWSLEERGITWDRAQRSLNKSAYHVTVYDTGLDPEKLIGMVRMCGDGEMYAIIQDLIVLPEYQGKGIRQELMKRLLKNVENKTGLLIGVCPSKVAIDFYSGFGFVKLSKKPNGYMYKKMIDSKSNRKRK